MNERFKFRFWDKKEKEYFTCGDIDHKSGILKTYPYRTYNWCFEHKNIIAEQCTGLKDKNGKLIYENDYVKYKGNIYKVFWNKTKISLENILNNDIIDIEEFDYMEIIGNEHENGNIEKIQENT